MQASLQSAVHGRQFLMFCLVGVFNTAVDFLAYSLAIVLGVSPALANILAFMVANPLSYLINSRVTFRRARAPAPVSLGGYGRFGLAHLVSLVIATAMVFFLSPRIGAFGAKGLAIAVTLGVNYLVSAFLVFPHGAETKPGPGESA